MLLYAVRKTMIQQYSAFEIHLLAVSWSAELSVLHYLKKTDWNVLASINPVLKRFHLTGTDVPALHLPSFMLFFDEC